MDNQCAIYSIFLSFDSVGIERAEDWVLENIFNVKSSDELNMYQKDLYSSIELMEQCNCLEEE